MSFIIVSVKLTTIIGTIEQLSMLSDDNLSVGTLGHIPDGSGRTEIVLLKCRKTH